MARFFVLIILTFVTSAWSRAQTGSPGGNSACAQWCADNFPNPGNVCTAPATRGEGPCYMCGPAKTSPTQQLCSGACSETSTDNKNCGGCGKICPSGSECSSGVCKCTNSGQAPCNGTCPDLSSDSKNCGKCGNTCPYGSTCSSGACKCTNSGQAPCNGSCPDFSSDDNNCGGCGKVCPAETVCKSSVCTPKCQSGQKLCSGSCTDVLNDPKNCGTCGNNCPSGVCSNGACTNPTCAGKTCSTFGPCGPGGSCVCASTTGGTGFCVDGATPCANLPRCESSSKCPSGEVCVVDSCCGVNVCVGATFCGGTTRRSLPVRRDFVNQTIANPGVWVD